MNLIHISYNYKTNILVSLFSPSKLSLTEYIVYIQWLIRPDIEIVLSNIKVLY